MAAVIPFIPLIVGGATAGASIYAANKQSGIANKSLAAETQYTDQAIAEQRRQEEYQRQQDAYQREQDLYQRQRQAELDRLAAQELQRQQEQREWERRRLEQQMANDLAQRRFEQSLTVDNTNHQRRTYGDFVQTLEPYRAAGTSANEVLARLVGITVPKYTGGTYYDLARNASVPVDVPLENG